MFIKKIKALFLVFIMLISFSVVSQVRKNVPKANIYKDIDLNIIRITDRSVYDLLDTLLKYERRCSYYTDSLPYGIYVGKAATDGKDSVTAIKVEGFEHKGIFLWRKQPGYFSYKGHDFFVTGEKFIGSIIMGEKRRIKYWENFTVGDDDSWAMYFFAYYGNEYILYDKANTYRCR